MKHFDIFRLKISDFISKMCHFSHFLNKNWNFVKIWILKKYFSCFFVFYTKSRVRKFFSCFFVFQPQSWVENLVFVEQIFLVFLIFQKQFLFATRNHLVKILFLWILCVNLCAFFTLFQRSKISYCRHFKNVRKKYLFFHQIFLYNLFIFVWNEARF